MAAPPPYWKKKTRPCPFYSQGRCLFSDACNFVHSVKIGHDLVPAPTHPPLPTDRETDVSIPCSIASGKYENHIDTEARAPSRSSSLGRSNSEKRRRVVLMSPPRSPRLSGLLSALEEVIGPDVEEVEIEEEDVEEGEEDLEERKGGSEKNVQSPLGSSFRESTSLPYYRGSPAAIDFLPGLLISERSVSPTPSLPASTIELETSTARVCPQSSLSRSRISCIPSPIITQHLDQNEYVTTVIDSDTFEVRPQQSPQQSPQPHLHQPPHAYYQDDDPQLQSRRQSTFELLTSPFPSPALRIRSSQIFPSSMRDGGPPISPVFGAFQTAAGTGTGRPYGDDDVDSLETLESSNPSASISTEESVQNSSLELCDSASPGPSLRNHGGSGSEESIDTGSIETAETSIENAYSDNAKHTEYEEEDGGVGSPHETERPSSEYFRTPKNRSSLDGIGNEMETAELGDIPPLPPSLMRGSGWTGRRASLVCSPALVQETLPAINAVDEEQGAGWMESSTPTQNEGKEEPTQSSAPTNELQPSSPTPPLPKESPHFREAERPSSEDVLMPKYERSLSGTARTAIEGHSSLPPPFTSDSVGIGRRLSQDTFPASEPPTVSFANENHGASHPSLTTLIPPTETRTALSPSEGKEGSKDESPPSLTHSEGKERLKRVSSPNGSSFVLDDWFQDLSPLSKRVEDFRDEQEHAEQPSSIRPASSSKRASLRVGPIAPITVSSVRSDSLESPASLFFDTSSPLSVEQISSHHSDTLSSQAKEMHEEQMNAERLSSSRAALSSVRNSLYSASTSSHERPSSDRDSPSSKRNSFHLAPIPVSSDRGDSLESPASLSFVPSPSSIGQNSYLTTDTLVDPEDEADKAMHETLLERRAKLANESPKRLAVVSLTSPTKELRESYFPASVGRTVRPAPSPLYDEPQRSASEASTSSAASSPRPSWADLQRRAGVSSKVPFGFRQSLLIDQEQTSSLSMKLASQFSHGSSGSRSSSISSSGSAVRPRPASRVDLLSGRARSVSPAPFATGPTSHRHSIASQTGSASSLSVRSSANVPRSASQLEFFSNRARSDSPLQSSGSASPSSGRESWMRPLRLSRVNSYIVPDSRCSSSLSHNQQFSTASSHSSLPHVRNASQGSRIDNTPLSSSRCSIISAYLNESNIPSHDDRTLIANDGSNIPSMQYVLCSAGSNNAPLEGDGISHRHTQSTGTVDQETTSNLDLLSPLSGSMRGLIFDELSRFHWPDSDSNTTNGEVTLTEEITPMERPTSPKQDTPIPPPPLKSTPTNTPIPIPTPCHAIATPRPTLMFAIASDNPAEVERALASGEARPNDIIGPQSALEFALTNDVLVNKTEIVKILLAYGADASALPANLRNAQGQPADADADTQEEEEDVLSELPSGSATSPFKNNKRKKRESVLNPAMKYYLNRATAGPTAAQASSALRRSDFKPLARMRFDFVGQDRALEHLYWVLGMHSQQPIGTPLVVLCCGPCGHGKSLLARKFGSLLDVPTHTVNMTVLKSSHDLWQCPSMSPYDPPSERTLAEFLEANAGKRCVVVLDEIDKNEDERTLWSLLAPWELGRCSIDAERRHIDVRNVIWLGTSNIGQDLVFEHHAARVEPNIIISKAEYRDLMNSLRPRVTDKLGTSLMSRVTAVLPFVPFTNEEKLAIASEAIIALGGEAASELEPDAFERLAAQCVAEYVETDGARSLYRSVSTHLMEAL